MKNNIASLEEYREKSRRCHISKYALNDYVLFKCDEDEAPIAGHIMQVSFSEDLILYSIQEEVDDWNEGCILYQSIREYEIIKRIED